MTRLRERRYRAGIVVPMLTMLPTTALSTLVTNTDIQYSSYLLEIAKGAAYASMAANFAWFWYNVRDYLKRYKTLRGSV